MLIHLDYTTLPVNGQQVDVQLMEGDGETWYPATYSERNNTFYCNGGKAYRAYTEVHLWRPSPLDKNAK